ncbi:OadG family protein [Motiliproteus sp. MSK22-1]|uniref:OadG family protein n=1 Tax=Motiliproteus sp. MSK22-1 TaxID=1897630 RepID=UPI00097537C7|nr:OadG family transporter subunit [Motiliproteus sp. MSK22-1]OMH29502.1 oxaloacetate decarboxylase [Motiliproteus sp. MSK22-1]
MASSDLVTEGVTLMVFGMGFVFVFLTLLVLVTNLMSKVVTKYAPDVQPQPAASKAIPAAAGPTTDQSQITAVITAAIHQYRAQHKK